MPARGPPRLRAASLSSGAQQLPAGQAARGLCPSPLPSLRRAPQPRNPRSVFPAVLSSCIFTRRQKSTAERAAPAPPAPACSAHLPKLRMRPNPLCGPWGSPRFPRPVNPAAPAAARTNPGASLLHGDPFWRERPGAARSGPRSRLEPPALLRPRRVRAPSARSAPPGCAPCAPAAAYPPRRWRAASAPRGKVLPRPPRVAFY